VRHALHDRLEFSSRVGAKPETQGVRRELLEFRN
jgi:hypothetical protein